MALYNLTKAYTLTTGSGTITIGNAFPGFLNFSQVVPNGTSISYGIQDGYNSEVGNGIYTVIGTTLSRSVLKSTNSGSPITLSGSAIVFITALAEDIGNVRNYSGVLDKSITRFDGESGSFVQGSSASIDDSGNIWSNNVRGSNTGDQTISLSGDLSGSGSQVISATISASAVTLQKMASMATSSLIYRKTAGTGVPEVNTLATLKTDLGLTGSNSGDQVIPSNTTTTAGQFFSAYNNTSGSFTKIQPDHTALLNIGTNSHAQIDTALTRLVNTSGSNTGDNAANSSTMYIGTTGVALNRASATLTLAGITLTTPNIGAATAISVNKVAIAAPATSASLVIADGKTLTVNQNTTLEGDPVLKAGDIMAGALTMPKLLITRNDSLDYGLILTNTVSTGQEWSMWVDNVNDATTPGMLRLRSITDSNLNVMAWTKTGNMLINGIIDGTEKLQVNGDIRSLASGNNAVSLAVANTNISTGLRFMYGTKVYSIEVSVKSNDAVGDYIDQQIRLVRVL